MDKRKLSSELVSVFEYMKNELHNEPHSHIEVNEFAYVTALLNCENSLAYQSLSSILMTTTLEEMKDFFYKKITFIENSKTNTNCESYSVFDKYFEVSDNICSTFGINHITSTILLLAMLNSHKKNSVCEVLFNDMKRFSVTINQIVDSIKKQTEETTTALTTTHQKRRTKPSCNGNAFHPIKVINTPTHSDTEIEKYTTNYSELSVAGKIQKVYNYDKYYKDVFTILSKKGVNNVAICGKSGVGKTAFVKNIANIINEKKCNELFHNKTLVGLDFSKLVIGTQFKGMFEQRFYALLEEAKRNGNYIFFIDNIQFIVNGSSKYAETDMDALLECLFSEPSIKTICTITEKAFSKLQKKSILGKYLQDVIIEEPTIDETLEILNKIKSEYEVYHNVKYNEESLKKCVELCKKYSDETALPESAIDLMDFTAAEAASNVIENPKVKELENKILEINDTIFRLKASSETKQYDKIDELVRQKISLKSEIGSLEKEDILSKTPYVITKEDFCSVFSKRIDIPLNELTITEKERLRDIEPTLKKSIIGQDEAIEEVCRIIKRQRVGLGENNRPAVLMFLGSTGTGKTYLAKLLAKELFGDEKYFVRMDMSEYADKTSINKISGSNPGYVGYDSETFLVKALKRKKRFILLLDEFEKSNEDVHNLFLQMFDEGRFTDNHGYVYSLKDVIIIMTSNVGVAESENRGAIGFVSNSYDFSKTIIERELKKKFKPEFLNRIQKIVYFNKLKEDSLKKIIGLEIQKLNNKVESLGHHLSEELICGKIIDDIYTSISDNINYGARPIVNEVQRRLEDNIVDYMIENDIEDGHTFTYEELSNLE